MRARSWRAKRRASARRAARSSGGRGAGAGGRGAATRAPALRARAKRAGERGMRGTSLFRKDVPGLTLDQVRPPPEAQVTGSNEGTRGHGGHGEKGGKRKDGRSGGWGRWEAGPLPLPAGGFWTPPPAQDTLHAGG